MHATGRETMEKKLSGRNSFRNGRLRVLIAGGMSLLFVLILSANAFAQNTVISGAVTSTGGTPLPGVTVRVQGDAVTAFLVSSHVPSRTAACVARVLVQQPDIRDGILSGRAVASQADQQRQGAVAANACRRSTLAGGCRRRAGRRGPGG